MPITSATIDRPRRTLFRGGWLMTQDENIGELRGDILVEGTRILAVAPKIDATADEIVDVAQSLVLPGFIDTHRHTWQSALRLIGIGSNFDTYIRDFLIPYGARFKPEDVYAGTLLGAISALDSGITTLRDESNIQNSPEHTDAAIRALQDSGIRAVFDYGYPLIDPATWLRNSTRPHPSDIQRLRRNELADDEAMVTLNMMLRGPELTTSEVTRADIMLMRGLGLRGCLHVGCGKASLLNPAIPALQRADLLGPDLTYIHCCMCSDAELLAIRDSGGSVSIPAAIDANMPGLGPPATGRVLKIGLRPSLSVDVESSSSPDMFTVMRAAFTAQQLTIAESQSSDQATFSPRDLLSFATIEGARACGFDRRTGSLTPGKRADLIVIRLDDVNLAPATDAAAAVVTSAHSGNIDSVMVNGRFVKRDRALIHIDSHRVIELAAASRERMTQAVRRDRQNP